MPSVKMTAVRISFISREVIDLGIQPDHSAEYMKRRSKDMLKASLRKPPPRQRIGGEEFEQLLRDFFTAAVAGMGAVCAEVFLGVFEVVELAAFFAIGPEIRTPEEKG